MINMICLNGGFGALPGRFNAGCRIIENKFFPISSPCGRGRALALRGTTIILFLTLRGKLTFT